MSKDGMQIVKIYKFQLDQIENTLRLTMNFHKCKSKKTSFDRDVMQSDQYVKNAKNGDYKKMVSRL